MGLTDPVKVYVGASNLDSQMVCQMLHAAGIEAYANVDFSTAGVWMGGTLPGVFDAGVYVSRADAERATTVIREHERLKAERSSAQGAEVEATCEECGKTAWFPAAQRGTVQTCPGCGAFMDVGEEGFADGMGGESAEEAE